MKITLFTSNQVRHIALIESLSQIAKELFVVQECTTIFPGEVDDFFKKSEVMQTYFSHVIRAERRVFGQPRFLPANVKSVSVKLGDLTKLSMELLKPALQSDLYVVFGSSYIKDPLIDFLVEKKSVNIHMGISPYYRGSSCNFWALYDQKPDLVGATIHLLSRGLDSGEILFHAVPPAQKVDPFELGMLSVKAAHQGLVEKISSGEILDLKPMIQDKSQEIRYTRNRDFTDEVASNYLKESLSQDEIFKSMKSRDRKKFINLFEGGTL